MNRQISRVALFTLVMLAALVVLGLAVLAPARALAEPNDGVVSGQVVDKTSGGGSVSGSKLR